VALKPFKVRKGLNIAPDATAAAAAGDIRVDSSDSNKLKFHNGTDEAQLIRADQAADLEFDNTGTEVLSTDVQAAIVELDADLTSTDTLITDHLTDLVNAHAASSILVTPAGNLAADDVQEALTELQTDVDSRAPAASPTFSGTITTPLTASRAVVTGASSELAASAVTATELGYVSGVSSAIQTQLNAKAPSASPTLTTPTADILTFDGQAGSPANPSAGYYKLFVKEADGKAYLRDSAGTETEIGAGITANFEVDRFSGDGVEDEFTLSSDPGTENNTQVFISGVYQQKDTYSVSGTTLTFTTAPPSGTDNVEVMVGATNAVNVPADASVTPAKLASNALYKSVRSVTTTDSPTAADDVLSLSGASFTVTLPTAVGIEGKVFFLRHDGTTTTQVYTVEGNAAETIDGAANYLLHTNGQTITLVSDGSNWLSIAKTKIAGHVGTAYYPVTANTLWPRANTAMGAFTADADAPSPTVESNPGPGAIQTTDNDLPQITVNSLPPGVYRVSAFFGSVPTGANNYNAFALYDGTTTTGEQGGASSVTTVTGGTVVIGTFTYTSSGNRTFEVHGRASTNTINIDLRSHRLLFVIDRLGDA
jgi:hypothetical protein